MSRLARLVTHCRVMTRDQITAALKVSSKRLTEMVCMKDFPKPDGPSVRPDRITHATWKRSTVSNWIAKNRSTQKC